MRALTFKEALQNDVKAVFLNPAEFGEPHTINGRKMLAVLDDMEHIEREKRMKSHMDGVYVRQLLLYVAAEDFGEIPPPGVLVKLDGKQYQVADAILDQYGIVSVSDLYEAADVDTDNYTLNKIGWTSIRSADIVRVRDEWMIKFPKPAPIDD